MVGRFIMFIISLFSKIFTRKKKIIGKIHIVKSDYGYLVPDVDIKSDIIVYSENLNYAIDGDIVEVSYSAKKNSDGKLVGKVTKILRRINTRAIGTLDKRASGYVFNITSFVNFYDVSLVNKGSINYNMFPCRVEAAIVNYPSKNSGFECEIINIFGPLGDDSAEFKMILKNYGIVPSFPDQVLNEADYLSKRKITSDLLEKREDFRNVFTLTIDPKSSKDFDDALSIVKLDNGNSVIGVHIADVSHYIKEGSQLDIEAYKRNTSVYFVDCVIPMLPDVLCNNICSLLPNEDRLTFSVIYEIDPDFNIVNSRICESVIHSNLRLTYDDAQQILDNPGYPYHDELSTLLSFSLKLKDERIKNGALNFNFYNLDFSVDDNNNLVVESVKATDSHVLVEELMILTNRTVAEYVAKIKGKNNKPPVFIYRVHPKPEKWKVSEFCKLLSGFQIFLDQNSQSFEADLNNIITTNKDEDVTWAISISAVRMMQKAYYSTVPIGHYGLALEYYSHFTSPIRRYNDILVHRLLKKYINSTYEYDNTIYNEKCSYSLNIEKNVSDAEREYLKFKQIKSLKEHEGEKTSGIIFNVTECGIFVELTEYKCIGLIRISSIDTDYVLYDKESKYAYGKFSGNIYKIGNKVNVVILKCNIEMRTVDLSFF